MKNLENVSKQAIKNLENVKIIEESLKTC
jgi:hypothetical protein